LLLLHAAVATAHANGDGTQSAVSFNIYQSLAIIDLNYIYAGGVNVTGVYVYIRGDSKVTEAV